VSIAHGESFNSSRAHLWQESAAFAAAIRSGAIVLAAAAATVRRPAFGLVGAGLQRLGMRHKHTSTGYPKNYVVIARKPGEAPPIPRHQ
jgi:hypothetical protein